jgi:hypothetical protein
MMIHETCSSHSSKMLHSCCPARIQMLCYVEIIHTFQGQSSAGGSVLAPVNQDCHTSSSEHPAQRIVIVWQQEIWCQDRRIQASHTQCSFLKKIYINGEFERLLSSQLSCLFFICGSSNLTPDSRFVDEAEARSINTPHERVV